MLLGRTKPSSIIDRINFDNLDDDSIIDLLDETFSLHSNKLMIIFIYQKCLKRSISNFEWKRYLMNSLSNDNIETSDWILDNFTIDKSTISL